MSKLGGHVSGTLNKLRSERDRGPPRQHKLLAFVRRIVKGCEERKYEMVDALVKLCKV